MKKIASVRRGEVIDKMFPHSMSLSRYQEVEYDPLSDEDEEVEVPIVVEWPCSVQKNVQELLIVYIIHVQCIPVCPKPPAPRWV